MTDPLLRRQEVEAITGLSRAGIYAAMSREEFPRPLKIGRRAVAWPRSVIDGWIEKRKMEAGIGVQE